MKEFFDAPSSKLDFFEAALEDIDFRYTFKGDTNNLYHIPVVRNQLTRGIQAYLPAMGEEVQGAFQDEIGSLLTVKGCLRFGRGLMVEWKPIPLYKKTMQIVARISYQTFIGSSVC